MIPREEVAVLAQLVVEKVELLEVMQNLLTFMEEEVYREHKSLGFNDAWSDLENLTLELEAELNDQV